MSLDTEPRASERAESLRAPQIMPDEPFYRRGEQARRWGAMLLLVGVVWLVFALSARGSLFGLGIGFVERSQQIPAQTFAVERVVVNGMNDDVEIVGWGGEGIKVEGTEHGYGWNGDAATAALERLEVVVEQRGDTLTVEVRRPGGINSVIGRSSYAELRISLPEGAQAEASVVSGNLSFGELRSDLTLSTVSGEIAGADSEGSLSINTTSGDVELRDHRGALAVESVSGDIQAEGAIERPQVKTVSGDVSLNGVSGPVALSTISGELEVQDARDAQLTLESTSGDIEFGGVLGGGASRISNISGDVSLQLEDAADLLLEATTTSGDLSADLPLRDLVQERRRLSGQLGDGAAALSISTTSGDVEVEGE